MRHLHVAELRDSWPGWLSVSITFVVVNAVFANIGLCVVSADAAGRAGILSADALDMTNQSSSIVLLLCVSVALLVIGSVTGLVIGSRRGSIARLGLAGASPSQVTGTLMSQLAAVSLASALVGDGIAALLVQPTLNLHTTAQEMPHIPAVVDPLPVLLANLGCVVLALLGGLRVAWQATRISPVEALRQAQATPRNPRMVLRIIGAVALTLLLIGLFGLLGLVKHIGTTIGGAQTDMLMAVMQVTFLSIPLTAFIIAWLAPLTIGLVTRAWTALIPGGSTWHLARNTVLGKMDRLIRSVVPTMLTFGLLFAMITLGESMTATLRALGSDVHLSGSDLQGLLLPLGGPLGIALAGSLSALLMMARQREAELALDGVLGATPAQRVAIPVLEGVIITVSSLLASSVMVAVEVAFMARGLPMVLPDFRIAVPWGQVALVTGVVGGVTVAATVLPTLASLRTPEPRVIARYVAA